MKASKRFDSQLRAADIPATIEDAAATLGDVGGMFRSIDQTLTLATARALIDATQPEADLDVIFGTIGLALEESGLASGPARVADNLLAQAARLAKKAEKPYTPGVALREASELTAAMFGHETARRKAKAAERKAAAEERKAKAQKALEDAKKRADKAEAEASSDDEITVPEFALCGEDGHVTPLTPEEYTYLAMMLAEKRQGAKDAAAAKRKADRDHAAELRSVA